MEVNEHIKPGMSKEITFQVEERYTAIHIGSGGLRVLATPSMIGFMERASHLLLDENLPAGYSSVGSLVEVRHLAPTPAEAVVRARGEVLQVEGRKVILAVAAWDALEKVGEGRHERVVIDMARFLNRVEEKKSRLEAR